MTKNDIFEHVAALAYPLPRSDEVEPPEALPDAHEHTWEQRAEYAENLRGAWDAEDADPLLTEIERVRVQREALDRQLRELIAYGREFAGGHRPYPLATLARAAGLGSHSSARTFYGDEEIAAVATATGVKRRSGPLTNSSTNDRDT